MLGVFELIHIIGLIGDQALNLPSRSLMDIQRSPEITVPAAKMKQEGPIWINHCTYEGVFVEYTRTWEEERNGTVWPAEPDTPAGFALILTKANCPDKGAEEAIFAVGEQVFHPKRVIRETQRISSLVLNADNCVIRRNWTGNPSETGQSFRAKLDSRSEATHGVLVVYS